MVDGRRAASHDGRGGVSPVAYTPRNITSPTLRDASSPQELVRYLGTLYAALSEANRYIANLAASGSADSSPPALTIPEIRAALEAGGSYPLSIEQLGGRARDPQTAGVFAGKALPAPQPYPPNAEFILIVSATEYRRYYRSADINPRWIELVIPLAANAAKIDAANHFIAGQIVDIGAAAGLSFSAANGSGLRYAATSELITLSTVGTTTDSAANLLPSTSRIVWVLGYVVQAITGGGVTTVKIGDATTADRFFTTTSLTLGSGFTGADQWQGSVATDAKGPVQYGAAKVRLTANATPTAGQVRIVVIAEVATSPTS